MNEELNRQLLENDKRRKALLQKRRAHWLALVRVTQAENEKQVAELDLNRPRPGEKYSAAALFELLREGAAEMSQLIATHETLSRELVDGE